MAKELNLSDFRDPDGYICDVRQKWDLSSEFLDSISWNRKTVMIGTLGIPERFQLVVSKQKDAEAQSEWLIQLMFWADATTQEIGLQTVFSLQKDVDEAIDLLRTIRPIKWWKRKALIDLTELRISETMSVAEAKVQESLKRELLPGEDDYWGRVTARGLRNAMDIPLARRRDRITDALLKEVAQVYRQAMQDGQNPTQAVATHFFKSHSTAARWVGLARKANRLGQADGSKGGEIND